MPVEAVFHESSLATRIADRVVSSRVVRGAAVGALVLVAAACSVLPGGDDGDGPYTERFEIGVECPDGTDLEVAQYPVEVTAGEAGEAYIKGDDAQGGEDDAAYGSPSMDTIFAFTCEGPDGDKKIPDMIVAEPDTKLGGDYIQFERPDSSSDEVSGVVTHMVKITVDGDDKGTYTKTIEDDDGFGSDNGISGDGEVVSSSKVQIGTTPNIGNIESGDSFAYGATGTNGYTPRDSSDFPNTDELDAMTDPNDKDHLGNTNAGSTNVPYEVRQRYEETRDSAILVIHETQLNKGNPEVRVKKID